MYLAQCTSNLYLILKDALEIENEAKLENQKGDKDIDIHQEYSEQLRSAKESYFFIRNKTLCHRMIHSKRPALSIEIVKQALKNRY